MNKIKNRMRCPAFNYDCFYINNKEECYLKEPCGYCPFLLCLRNCDLEKLSKKKQKIKIIGTEI